MAPYGSYSEDAIETWDFARCQKSDGTIYGTKGKCRKGKEIDDKEDGGKGSKSRPYAVAVTQGRFNIPHMGHVKLIKEMLEQADTAHVLIGKGKDNVDQDLRSQFLRAALRHAGVDLSRVKLIKQENLLPYAKELGKGVGSSKAVAVLGEDQEKFLDVVNKTSKVETHKVPRTGEGASSTKIRQMIDSGDLEGLKKAYEGDTYLMRLAIAAHSVEKDADKWGSSFTEGPGQRNELPYGCFSENAMAVWERIAEEYLAEVSGLQN
jgi:cytidyltransferase-like protein